MFGLFNKKKQSAGDGSRYLKLKVHEIRRETTDAISLVFDDPDRLLKYKPGQFVTLIFNINGKEERRSYSLCSSPLIEENPTVTINRIADGKVSNYINDHVQIGDEITLMEAMGTFTTDIATNQKRHVVILGAGSGITPLMSIIKSVLHAEKHSVVTLLYANRNEDSIIFYNEMQELQEKYKDRFSILHILSQPDSSWEGIKGRLTNQKIKDLISGIDRLKIPEGHYFICGPTGFMHTTEEALAELGVQSDNVFKESFVSSGVDNAVASSTEEIVERNVSVVLEGNEHRFLVPPSRTILEAGLDEQLDMPYSCQSGLCTACRGKLISGNVHMEEEDGLSEQEIKDGYILCCVSHPLNDEVKIDLG